MERTIKLIDQSSNNLLMTYRPKLLYLDKIFNRERVGLLLSYENNDILIGDQREFIKRGGNYGIIFNDSKALDKFLKKPRLLNLGNLYIKGKINIFGDIFKIIEVIEKLPDVKRTNVEKILYNLKSFVDIAQCILKFKFHNEKHYNLSASVYEAFLDENMQYTCGYFKSQSDSLLKSQINKLELIAQVTKLKPGSSYLDIGCGWGGAVRYMSKHKKAESIGITNCEEQASYANKRNKIERNESKIIIGDYSKFVREDYFDAISVVGMLEHVKKYEQDKFFKHIYKCLKPNGRLYLQCIVKSDQWIGGDGTRFLQKHVFPGYYLNKIEDVLNRASRNNLDVSWGPLDHSLHYSMTTKQWVLNLIENQKEILSIQNDKLEIREREYRLLLAYLAMATRLFATGRGALYRMAFKKSV